MEAISSNIILYVKHSFIYFKSMEITAFVAEI